MKGAIVLMAAAAIGATAAGTGDYHGRKAWTLSNGKIEVVVTPGGGHIASLMLRDGPAKGLNPLWLPPWPSKEIGEDTSGEYGGPPAGRLLRSILGHNICLDFFGSPSAAETKAGIAVHGEAPCVNWTADKQSPTSIAYSANLPTAQMRASRTITLAKGSTALWIVEKVKNLSALDRPFGWQQHVTFGPPFLEQDATVFDVSGRWSMVYPKEFSKGMMLKRGAQFDWPHAIGTSGEMVDVRHYPRRAKNSDFTVTLASNDSAWAWFTALNTKTGLMCGYVWPRAIYPWICNWEENHFRDAKPWNKKAVSRGIEFGTTPFPDSRRDMVTLNRLHDTPTYRWLDARGADSVGYGAFLLHVPAGATGARRVTVEGNSIVVELAGINVDKPVKLTVRR